MAVLILTGEFPRLNLDVAAKKSYKHLVWICPDDNGSILLALPTPRSHNVLIA